MPKSQPNERSNLVRNGDSLSISGDGLIDLMRAVHAKDLPFRFSARGASMAPLIRDGDIVSIAPFQYGLPLTGDVVAFIHPETKSLCVHRVVSTRKDAFILQGDNMQGKPDGPIPREAIIGRVARVERGGERIRLGLGPERFLIAVLSRRGVLDAARKFASLYGYLKRRRRPCAKG